MTRHRGPRGFAILEAVFVLVLTGVAAVIAARLFTTTMHVCRDATAAANALRAERQWLATMRADAWGATRVNLGDPATATFATADGAAVWSCDDAWLTRTRGDDVRRWPSHWPLRFRRDGRSLAVVGDVVVPLATPSVGEEK